RDAAHEDFSGYTEISRSLRLVPAEFGERLNDDLPLYGIQRHALGNPNRIRGRHAGSKGLERVRQIRHGYFVARAKDYSPFNEILRLSYISRPFETRKEWQQVLRQPQRQPVVTLHAPLEKLNDKLRNVFCPVP